MNQLVACCRSVEFRSVSQLILSVCVLSIGMSCAAGQADAQGTYGAPPANTRVNGTGSFPTQGSFASPSTQPGNFSPVSNGRSGVPPRVAQAPGGSAGPPSLTGNNAFSGIPTPVDPNAEAPSEGQAGQESKWFMSHFSTFWQKLMAGGPLMVPLALCSLVVIALAVERMVALRRGRVIPKPFVRRFTECVQDGQLSHDEALEICDEFDCPVAEVFHATVKRWGRPTVEIEQAVMDAGERIADGLRKYLRLFSAVSNVAPLLGLLGTVLGMIDAFEVLSSGSSDSPSDLLASGISQALITTAAGLSVAIPAYLAFVYFSARADKYLVEIDALCQQVVDSISAEGMSSSSGNRSTKRGKRAA